MKTMEKLVIKGIAALALAVPLSFGTSRSEARASEETHGAQQDDPLLTLPKNYRDWRLISVAHEAGKLNDLRAVMGNDQAIDAYRSSALPFPDGTIITRLAWAYTPSEENNKAFGQDQSFVAGARTNVQLMVKDSKRFASTGGWGFAQFTDGKPAPAEATKACFSCHAPAKQHDYVFTHYAP